jgi:hypothetical protein
MMSPADASRAVVPVLADCPVELADCPADPAAGAPIAPAADGTATARWAADEAAKLPEVLEHPASTIPPASMVPPIARPAAAPNRVRLVRADRRFRLSAFDMPV